MLLIRTASLQFFSFTNSNEKTGPLGERARLVFGDFVIINLDVLLNVFRRVSFAGSSKSD